MEVLQPEDDFYGQLTKSRRKKAFISSLILRRCCGDRFSFLKRATSLLDR